MADTHPERYVVSTPDGLLQQFKKWADEATAIGSRYEFIAALKRCNEMLETQPHRWGDLLRESRTIDAVFRRGMIANWFLVWYGVLDEAHTVVVHDLAPAPGSPLSSRLN